MEPACRMGGLLELSDSKSYEDLKKSDYVNKQYDTSEETYYKKNHKKEDIFFSNPQSSNPMTNSTASVSECTPTDSGVQMDSENSEMSVSGFDSDTKIMEQSLEDAVSLTQSKQELVVESNEIVMTNSDIANSNVIPPSDNVQDVNPTEDTEIIVYRRKITKKLPTAPKKRVSFHEDILKNTRTDNIHIERGFITYKPNLADGNSRYSWCSEGDHGNRRKNVLQRNACSDVIDYGNTEVTPTLFIDNSGVFEYAAKPIEETKVQENPNQLYVCSCSGSDCSLTESEDSVKNTYDENKKSASCECIGSKKFQENIENGNYYYSEPNIGERNYTAMWSKEKKPKSSCLKKTSANILQEPINYNTIKSYNRHQRSDSYLNDTKNIFGSLKNIYKNMSFGLDLPERGVPEGSEDVMECLPDHETNNAKSKPFLSKSFDAGFCHVDEDESYPKRTKGDGHSRTYIHDVDAQLRRKNTSDIFPRKDSIMTKSDIQRNKYIINCESTVFEHTGVSYGYDYQNFVSPQEPPSVVNTPKESYVPLKEKFTSFLKTLTDRRDSSPSLNTPGERKSSIPERRDSNISQKVVEKKAGGDVNSDNESVSASEVSGSTERSSKGNNKHLASPMKKKGTAQRLEKIAGSPKHLNREIPKINITQSSPYRQPTRTQDITSIDDSFSITTDEDDNITIESGIENFEQLLKYPQNKSDSSNLKVSLKVSNKTSLIDRFLRNITQKKILESKLHANDFYVKKLNSEKQVLKDLYVKRARPKKELCDSLDEEIKREIEQNSPVKKNSSGESKVKKMAHRNELGEVGSECYGLLSKEHFRDRNEILQKVYNVYSAYDADGNMQTLTVFLTDRTLYVCELASSKSQRYRNAFVLPYGDLDVILVGPRGQTVLISNSARDMQMTLCVGGATVASSLAAAIELCVQKNNYIKRNYRPALNKQSNIISEKPSRSAYTSNSDWASRSNKNDSMTQSVSSDLDESTATQSVSLMNSSILSQSMYSEASDDAWMMTQSVTSNSDDVRSVTSGNSSVYGDVSGDANYCGSLPGFGVLTLCHLSGLKRFACENSSVETIEPWHFYSIIHSKDLGSEINGENCMSGYLMYRMLKGPKQQTEQWRAAYFMLKGGVLYRFSSSTENNNSSIPCWACPLFQAGRSICKGAHRLQCPPFERPHAFELLLMEPEENNEIQGDTTTTRVVESSSFQRRTSFASGFFDSGSSKGFFGSSRTGNGGFGKGFMKSPNKLQLAASDEQSASDWLQALIQAASGVFDFPESKPAKASTLVLTSKHILLVRESFENLLPMKTALQNSKYLLKTERNLKTTPSAQNLTVREKYLEFLRQQQQIAMKNAQKSDQESVSDDVVDVAVDSDKPLEEAVKPGVPGSNMANEHDSDNLKSNRNAMHLDLTSDVDAEDKSSSAKSQIPKQNNFVTVKESGLTRDDAMSLASDASDDLSCVTTSASDASCAKLRHGSSNATSSPDRRSVLEKIRKKMSIADDGKEKKDKDLLRNINNSRKSEFGKGVKVLSCASLAEICAVKIPVGKGVENCCVVEFACHEVSESGGDMVLFFTNGTDLDKFIATLEVLWSHNNTDDSPFPISTLDLNNQVNAYYGDTFQVAYKKNWIPTHSGLSQALRNK